MVKNNFFRQCTLNRRGLMQIAWIPEALAQVGKTLSLKDERYPDEWRVQFVGPTRQTADQLTPLQREFVVTNHKGR